MSCLSQKLGTASGPGDFQLLVFFKAVCNSSGLMSSHGWHSISVYFCSSLFIHSAEWLYSLLFSKMVRQNVSVASFLGGYYYYYYYYYNYYYCHYHYYRCFFKSIRINYYYRNYYYYYYYYYYYFLIPFTPII